MNKYFKNYESFTKTNDFYINTNEGIITNGVIFIDLKTMEFITPLTSIKESFFLFEKEGQGILSDIGDAVKSVGSTVGGVVSNLTTGAIKALTPQGTSEWLHFTADTISMILDFIPLGLTQVASFVIDIMNGGSYFIETEFYPAEKIPLTIAGLLTLGFASVPALGNEAGITSKQAIKSTIKNISKTSLKDFVKMGIKKGSKKESEFIAVKLFKGIFNFLPKGLQKFLAPVLKWVAKGASFVFGFITKTIEIILKTASAPFKYILEIIGFGKLVTKLKGYISKSASKEAIDTIAVQSDVFAKGIDNGIPVEKIEAEALSKIESVSKIDSKGIKNDDILKIVNSKNSFKKEMDVVKTEINDMFLKKVKIEEIEKLTKPKIDKIYSDYLNNSNLKKSFHNIEDFKKEFNSDVFNKKYKIDNQEGLPIGLNKKLLDDIEKINKLGSFDPKKIELQKYTYGDIESMSIKNGKIVGGIPREIISAKIEGIEEPFIFYISSGTCTPGLKSYGDLQLISGFEGVSGNGRYYKLEESVEWAKTNNYMKEFQEFYNKNGFEGLKSATKKTETNLTSKIESDLISKLNQNTVPKGWKYSKLNLDTEALLKLSKEVDEKLASKKLVSNLTPLTQAEIKSIEKYTKDVSVVKIDKSNFAKLVTNEERKKADEILYVIRNNSISKPIKKENLTIYLEEQKIESINFVNYCNEKLMSHKNIIGILLKRYVGMNFMHWWNAMLIDSKTIQSGDVLVIPYEDSASFEKLSNVSNGSVGDLRTDEQKQAIVDFCKYINDAYKFTNPAIIQSLKSIKDKENNGIEQDVSKYLFDKYENIKPFGKLFQAYINNIVKPTEPLVIDGVIGSKTLQSTIDLFTNKMPRKGGLDETNKLIDILQK